MIAGTIINLVIIAIIIGIIYLKISERKNNKQTKEISKEQLKKYENLQKEAQSRQNTVIHKYVPYTLIESVLTNYEKLLYSILAPFCSKYNFILLSKVRIADFVTPLQQNNRSNFYHWFNKIASKHVDFLICQPQTFRPLVAIELDDYTHKYKSRQERDIFVDDVYASVGLPVLHITQLQETNIVRQLSEILNISLPIENTIVQ